MSVIREYLQLQKESEQKYGERTVVFSMVGSFYECWEYNMEYCTSKEARIDDSGKIWDESIGHAINISVILNCVLTFENSKKNYSISNCHKVGFPCLAWEKNLATLLANDYTVVRVDQKKDSTTGKVTRYIADVCSPTMNLNNIASNRTTSNIACLYIEYQQGIKNNSSEIKFDNFLITTGVAVIDIITGQNRVAEFYSKNEDQIYPVQELYRFLITHYPRELIIHIGDMPEKLNQTDNNPYIRYLEKVLELYRFDRLTTNVNAIPSHYKKIPHQTEFFNKIFNKDIPQEAGQTTGLRLNIVQKRNEKIIEDLGLERVDYGRIAYMVLLQHCHKHNTDIISRLSRPDLEWLDEQKHLILTHNAIVQLDLVPEINGGTTLRKRLQIDSLVAVLDQNQTLLGRRYLYNMLQNPMCNSSDIQIFYDMIDEMLSNKVEDDPLWLYLERQLKELPDIGRLQRKLEIKLITPKELAILYNAYIKIINIYLCILKTQSPTLHKQLFSPGDANSFNQFVSRFSAIINFEALECCFIDSGESKNQWFEFTENPIRSGIYQDIDIQIQKLTNAENSLGQIIDHLNTFLAHTKGEKLKYKTAKKKQGATKQDPTGVLLTTTVAKANILGLAPVDINLCGKLQILQHTTSDRIITSDIISALCAEIDGTKMLMRYRLLNIYESIIDEMVSKYTFYVPVASLVAKIDLIHSYAKVSYRYNYHRPEIVPPTERDNKSFVRAKQIRHPIIERIIDGAYVTNDITLGVGDKDDDINQTNGMLLYGINASGKTSIAKAVGLNIIMAQAGCYTPSQLSYRPYKKIITRLSGNDNLFKGKSSFEVEMEELRTILRQADANTLVVGDELCHGSETHSGMAITASTLLYLIEKQSTFLFATHMHELLNLSYINTIPSEVLRICHLSIMYDDTTDCLIYNRKINEGSGSSLYGLMVAKSLGLPIEFINQANEMLLEITNQNKEIICPKRSRYNGKVYVDSCAICSKTKAETELHTHHIIEQSKAVNNIVQKVDDNINIGTMHKNAKDNLIVLCRDCHTNLHAQGMELETLNTTQGTIIRMRSNISS